MPLQQAALIEEKMPIHKTVIAIFALLVALILIGNHYGITYICSECPKCDYSRSSVPETSPSETNCEGCNTPCGLVQNSNCIGRTVTVSGSAESVQAKTSKKGNTYYVFEICQGGHCIEAFSWTFPDGNEFSGNYKDSGYGPQLTVSGNSKRSEGTANTEEGVDSEMFVNLKSEIKMKTTTTLLLTVLLATTAAADFTYIDIYDVIDSWKDGEFSLDEVMNYFAFVKTQCGQNSKCFFSKFPYAKPNMDKFEQRLDNTREAFPDSCITGADPETATDTRMNSLKEFYYVNKVGLWIHGLNNYVTNSTRQLQLEISKGC